jgi:hypothetical protein
VSQGHGVQDNALISFFLDISKLFDRILNYAMSLDDFGGDPIERGDCIYFLRSVTCIRIPQDTVEICALDVQSRLDTFCSTKVDHHRIGLSTLSPRMSHSCHTWYLDYSTLDQSTVRPSRRVLGSCKGYTRLTMSVWQIVLYRFQGDLPFSRPLFNDGIHDFVS